MIESAGDQRKEDTVTQPVETGRFVLNAKDE